MESNTFEDLTPEAGALALLDLGYSPVMIEPGTRKPLEKSWQRYCKTPITRAALAKLLRNHPGLGLGVALGYANVFALDVDTGDREIWRALRAVFPFDEAPGKRGMHGATFFFRSEEPFKKRHFNGVDGARLVDLLSVGAQTVIPPTQYAPKPEDDDGVVRYYRWLRERMLLSTRPSDLPLIRANVADKVAACLAPFMPVPPPPIVIAVRSPGPISDGERHRYQRTALAALERYQKELAAKCRPGRGHLVYVVARILGRYVHHGLLPVETLEAALTEASRLNGWLDQIKARGVQSAINNGLRDSAGEPLLALKERPYDRRLA